MSHRITMGVKEMLIAITETNFDDFVLEEFKRVLQRYGEFFGSYGYYLRILKYAIFRNYINLGYHYIGDWKDETEIQDYLESKTREIAYELMPIMKQYTEDRLGHPFDSYFSKYVEVVSASNDTMTEISPIDAVIGEITTPNTKGKVQHGSTNTKTDDSFDIKKQIFNFINRREVALINQMKKYFDVIVEEKNTVY